MYELNYDGQKHEFADESAAHGFLQAELDFKKKADYDRMFTEYASTPSNTDLSATMFNFVSAMPQELRGLMDELRKTEWRVDNEAARAAWEKAQEAKKLAQTANFTAMQAKELEAIKQDEMGRWLIDHPQASEADFQKIWPHRLAQLEKQWSERYYQDKMGQLRARGGIF